MWAYRFKVKGQDNRDLAELRAGACTVPFSGVMTLSVLRSSSQAIKHDKKRCVLSSRNRSFTAFNTQMCSVHTHLGYKPVDYSSFWVIRDNMSCFLFLISAAARPAPAAVEIPVTAEWKRFDHSHRILEL